MICLPILFTTSLRSPSLIVLIKFCLMCRIQYPWAEPVSCQPFIGSLNALLIDSCLSETMQMDIPFVTCLLRFFKKKLHPSFVSPSTSANAIGIVLLFPSCATASNNVPLYLPYNHVPSTWTTGLQYLKPWMHG